MGKLLAAFAAIAVSGTALYGWRDYQAWNRHQERADYCRRHLPEWGPVADGLHANTSGRSMRVIRIGVEDCREFLRNEGR